MNNISQVSSCSSHDAPIMATRTNSTINPDNPASRSFHHDDPPSMPMTTARTTKTTTIRIPGQEEMVVELPPPTSASSRQSRSSFLASTSSSARLSLANTSTGSSSNRSGFTFRSGTRKRSLDLRKLPIDTSLFSNTNKKKGKRSSSSSLAGGKKNSIKQKDDDNAQPQSTQSTSDDRDDDDDEDNDDHQHDKISSTDDQEEDEEPSPIMDNSEDNTHQEEDDDDESIDVEMMNSSKQQQTRQQQQQQCQSPKRRRRRKRRPSRGENSSSNTDEKSAGSSNKKTKGTSSQQESMARRFLRSTCLRSNFSLQTQLLLSFGIVSSLTIGIVLTICVAVSIVSGDKVHDLTKDSLEEFSYAMEGKMVRYVAEALDARLLPHEIVQILHDATVDRFVGYPDHPGYENDTLTPFQDVYTQTNIYPVKGPDALMDWDLQDQHVTLETAQEHVQHRYDLYRTYKYVNTARASYNFQGSCNPAAAPGDYDYYPNCTNANNNIVTGGVVHPVSTSQHLYHRASDLTPLLKAIYEKVRSVRDVGICFANDGAGSCLQFPGFTINGTLSYVSEGCDWMNQPNPYKPEQPIGTPEMQSKCHPKGEVVYNREYNPMERPWCFEQALDPHRLHMVGPFQDAWNEEAQLILVGRAIYDPLTWEFVGCMFIDATITGIQQTLKRSKVTPNSHVTITRFDEQGTVTASTAWKPSSKAERRHEDEDGDGSIMMNGSQDDNQKGKPPPESDGPHAVHQLEIGIQEGEYQDFYTMIDYDKVWDPQKVRETYASTIHEDAEHGYLVAAYPLPHVPKEYDPDYRPNYLIIMSVSTGDVLAPVDRLQAYVDDRVHKLCFSSIVAALVGWGLMMAVIFVVSQALTFPLKSMNQATKAIVQNFGGKSEKGITYNSQQYYAHPMLARCTPETEISQVVCEFEKMVQKFSGSSKMAKAVQERFTELVNHFSFEHEFEELYQSREDGAFAYGFDEIPINRGSCSSLATSSTSASHSSHSQYRRRPHRKKTGLHLVHFGPIVTGSQSHLNLRRKKKQKNDNIPTPANKRLHLTSPLFVWIVVFIVSPLLLTTVTMSAIVTYNVSAELSTIVDGSKLEYVEMEKFSLQAAAKLRASWITSRTDRSTRDLHFLTRYASWLLFGGLERRDSFTKLQTGAEECKTALRPSECSYVRDVPCECTRDSKYGTCLGGFDTLRNYSFRYQQETYFVCESHDTASDGDRNSSLSFPLVSDSPRTTAWWSNVTMVPGSSKGAAAAGYETTYDRLRVLSAIPVFQTLYNQNDEKRTVLQSAVAMEADGMVVGYHGCAMTVLAAPAFWESTYSNRAAQIRPNLCPTGKFGYDPRCREFYDTGKKLGETQESNIYIAAPYPFAVDNIVGQTCTSPLIDPHTGEHVGQAFVDYRSDPIFDILSPSSTILGDGGYPILIAARDDLNGANTVVGPGVKAGDGTEDDIEEIILKNDLQCLDEPLCELHREEFREVMRSMRSGETGTGSFSVRLDDGTDETMFIAFAPVKVKSLAPVDSSDFGRGIIETEYTVYYLALTETQTTLVSSFDQVEDDIKLTIDIGILVLSIAIILAIFTVVYISYWVAISITQPMSYLLELIRKINEVDDEEILVQFDLEAGSLEVKSVANTMRTLHKVVQCANSAYFAGDIDKAYAVLTDASRLFKRLGNKKAMGVAYNNLGNTMLAMYRTAKGTGAGLYCGMTRSEIVLKGMSYFHQSIQLGEKAYDEFYEAEGWSPCCLDFMQHLSNRYFNRAMFLLTVKDDHENPKELESLGMRDLQIARDMDVEIIDQGTEVGWKVNTVEKLYNVALNRARGHLLLLEIGYPDDWDLEELLEDLFASLKKEIKSKLYTSGLFHELGPAGRMQQVETELMRYNILKGTVDTASKIGIRMLMEDEYILPEAQIKAVQVLLLSIDQDNVHLRGQLALYEAWLQRAKSSCDSATATITDEDGEDMSDVVMLSLQKLNMSLAELDVDSAAVTSEEFRKTKTSSLLATTRGDVTMEIF